MDSVVPVFFFDIQDGGFLPDRQGLELGDLEEAQAHCLDMALTFLKQPPAEIWRDHAWEIVLRDAAGDQLYQLAFQVTTARRDSTE